jgi:hypothetical protein
MFRVAQCISQSRLLHPQTYLTSEIEHSLAVTKLGRDGQQTDDNAEVCHVEIQSKKKKLEITAYLNKMRDLKAFGAYANTVKVQASIGFLSLLKYCRLYQNLHNDSLMQPVSIHHSSPS